MATRNPRLWHVSRRLSLPVVCGALAFAVLIYVWGSLAKVPVGSDEMAYVLQARIFVSGRVVGLGRPLPDFFQQYHVLTTPVLASKYPPGHSLLLSVGAELGLIGLMPALVLALSAALLGDLARRLANGAVAVMTVILATTSDIALRFNPSYFSETTTAATLITMWWALFEYHESGSQRWLILCAAAAGWGAITRPFTAIAFGIPALIVAIVLVHRRRSWKHVFPAAGVAVIVLALLPLWNARVTGDWRTMTQSEWARLYMPSDGLGFGTTAAQPAAHLSPEVRSSEQVFREMHRRYTSGTLPTAAAVRAANIIRGTWSYGGVPGILVLIGVLFLPIVVSRIIIATLVVAFVAYLGYAHEPTWTLYYLEFQAPLALLTVVGSWGLANWIANGISRLRPTGELTDRRLTGVAFTALSLLLLAPVPVRIQAYRRTHAAQRRYREQFEAAIAALPPGPRIVFVRYTPGHGEERLVDNTPDLSTAPVWVVHDCGADNSKLLAIAPGRTPYLYREWLSPKDLTSTIGRWDDVPTRERIGAGAPTC